MKTINPQDAPKVIGQHMMVKDHFSIVMDLEESYGPYIVDARKTDPETGATIPVEKRRFLDFYTQFASWPISYNHPGLEDAAYQKKLTRAAQIRIACSDIVTPEMAAYIDVMHEVAIPKELSYLFLIDGGALAVENALKAAFDWKVRTNFKKGVTLPVEDYQIVHLKEAFHGRTGYTMSLTNTDPKKVMFFPKFTNWPRIENPKIVHPLADHLETVKAAEERSIQQLMAAIAANPHTIAGLILETIQGEGGDNHFRPEYMQRLRAITEAHDIIMILDEVQTGCGLTGKFWAYEHYGVTPDVVCFGKKMQVCGILASREKFGRVKDHVFEMPSRINSTWGGSLVDMIRSARLLEIIRDEKLVENAAAQGEYLLGLLRDFAEANPKLISNPRGRGLMCAFDVDTAENRDRFVSEMMKRRVLVLSCGARSVRFRPVLDIQQEHLDAFADAAREVLKAMGQTTSQA